MFEASCLSRIMKYHERTDLPVLLADWILCVTLLRFSTSCLALCGSTRISVPITSCDYCPEGRFGGDDVLIFLIEDFVMLCSSP